jgi:Zn finger protein HypA/HybF involved in hydrogenase expression
MSSQIEESRLDGNAIGGLLQEIFAMEMTSAVGTCAHCGAVNEVGRVQVYVRAPGTVVRCPGCEQVLMKIVRGRGRLWIDMSGVRTLELATASS